jgi:hypothetical protein
MAGSVADNTSKMFAFDMLMIGLFLDDNNSDSGCSDSQFLRPQQQQRGASCFLFGSIRDFVAPRPYPTEFIKTETLLR